MCSVHGWTVVATGDVVLHTTCRVVIYYAGSYRWGWIDADRREHFLLFDVRHADICPAAILDDPHFPRDRQVGRP